MKIIPANGNEHLNQEQLGNYIQHIRDLYDANKTECFQKMLIPETKPCTISLTRITKLPWKWPPEPEEETYWQLKCFTTDDYNSPLEREYYFTDDGQLRFFREMRENVVGDTIIELDANEFFVSWEESSEEPEDGLGWVLYTYMYDENGNMLDRDYVVWV